VFSEILETWKAMAERDSLEILKADAMHEVRQAATSITLNPRAFQGGIPEVSIFRIDEYGVPCKCRLDWLKPRTIVDLKKCASPMTTCISVPRSSFRFLKGAPRHFASSQGVRRGFCENCGSPLTYESERIPDEVHLYAASLVTEATVVPNRHVFVSEQLPWFEVLDDLPRYATTSRGGAPPVRIGPRKL
jgi:hypothetical protein